MPAANLVCPKCRSNMVPMGSGKGFRCGVAGNRWVKGRWSKCDGVIWNNARPGAAKKVIERANDFPFIATPTEEQIDICNYLALAPAARGGRALIVNAGPGTAKTTTVSWSLRSIYGRRGNLDGYGVLAFNVNARDVLLGKLPLVVSGIATLNGHGAKAQGYSFRQYSAGKLRKLYKEAVSHIPYDERLPLGIIGKIIERSRDICLFSNNPNDTNAWGEIIVGTLCRFPGLAKKYSGSEKHVAEYLPSLAVAAHKAAGTIDIQEQITRPVTDAIARTGWTIDTSLVQLGAEWTDADVEHFASLIRSIRVPQVPGLIIDEAQDLSLCQIAVFLAQVWATGELTIIGDDKAGQPGEVGYKAGQAIYGWRGAFGGSMTLIARLWKCLTGETAREMALTVTHRCCPEIVEAIAPLNSVLRSSRKPGQGGAYECSPEQAWNAWLALPEGQSALWITRTNAPLATLFLDTLREHQEVSLRGGADFGSTLDNELANAAGWADDNGEFDVTLAETLDKLRASLEADAEENGEVDPNSLAKFFIEVAEAVTTDASLLSEAGLTTEATVGNVRRFILSFADKNARRVLSTVYRCKGDEADLVVVSDVEKFNQVWNGDADESAAVRHVAASRARNHLLVVGSLLGVNCKAYSDTQAVA